MDVELLLALSFPIITNVKKKNVYPAIVDIIVSLSLQRLFPNFISEFTDNQLYLYFMNTHV